MCLPSPSAASHPAVIDWWHNSHFSSCSCAQLPRLLQRRFGWSSDQSSRTKSTPVDSPCSCEASVASAGPSRRASVTDRMRSSLHWLDVSERIYHLQTLCTGIQVSDRSRTILPNVVVCSLVARCGSCQPQISKHEHHAPSTNKNDQAARIFLLLPSCMEPSPQCSQNLGLIAVRLQEKPGNISFSKLILL